jgi:predicted transposase YbfD/YdcC
MALPGRLRRRIVGVLSARLPELKLAQVKDPRKPRGKRWPLVALLTASFLGLLCGKKNLEETEELTAELPLGMRRKLRLPRRVPDTTMRDTLVRLSVLELRRLLHQQTRAAHRRKALRPEGLPFGVLAVDGKRTALPCWDQQYAQRQSEEGQAPQGVVTTLTACLISASARPCVDIIPVPAATNEMGHFRTALAELVATYGQSSLFHLLSYDSGACSEDNARAIRDTGLHYLFVLKENQPTLLLEAQRLLGGRKPAQADDQTVDVRGAEVWVRRLYLTTEMAGYLDWSHLHTVLRVETEVQDKSGRVLQWEDKNGRMHPRREDRYFLGSLESNELTTAQWLQVIRGHWGVENGCHWTLDAILQEDKHPWIEADAQGMVVVAVLRRLAYNLLSLYRNVTQRGESQRETPWKKVVRWFLEAIENAREEDLSGLRPRRAAATN